MLLVGALGGAGAAAATGAGGRGAVGGGAGPFVLGASIVADAISSSREVAASSLWMVAVSSARGMVEKTLSSMIVIMLIIDRIKFREERGRAIPFDESS